MQEWQAENGESGNFVNTVGLNLDDLDIEGVDFDTLKDDGFPQLKFENALVIQRLFESIKKDLDLKTRKLPFNAFI